MRDCEENLGSINMPVVVQMQAAELLEIPKFGRDSHLCDAGQRRVGSREEGFMNMRICPLLQLHCGPSLQTDPLPDRCVPQTALGGR